MTNKVSKESQDLVQEKITELKKLLPEVIAERKVDFEKLKLTLGEDIDGKEEKYSFNWAGRKESFKNIQTTAKGTLIPAKDESVNFDNTENLFIEGDNLEVLKLLQKTYFNQIKMIYIDPPYNTGKDFVYKDNFHNSIKAYLEQTGQSNGDGVKLTTNPETNGRFHSDWISMMYPRLFIARNLLRDDGVIFISIDDNEVTNLRKICDEIFGEENFIACFTLRSNPRGSQASKLVALEHEYILGYTKNIEEVELKGYEKTEEEKEEYDLSDKKGKYRFLGLRQRGGAWRREQRPNMYFPIYVNPNTNEISLQKTKEYSKEVLPKRPSGEDSRWTWSKGKVLQDKYLLVGKLVNRKGEEEFWDIFRKDYLIDENGEEATKKVKTIWVDKEINYQNGRNETKELFGNSEIFDFPKPSFLVKKLVDMLYLNDEDILLDFFAGSGTTAHAVLELNRDDGGSRRFVCVQLPELTDVKSQAYKAGYKNIAEICKERIRRVIKNLGKEQKGKLVKNGNLDLGFKVFKLEKSNYKIWEKYEGKDEKELKKQLELFKTPLISGYKEIDIIYECIIKEGYSLNSKIEKTEIKSNKVYKVTDGEISFYICLDEKINDKTLDELNLKKDNMFICLDEALNDSKKKNLSIQCNLKTI